MKKHLLSLILLGIFSLQGFSQITTAPLPKADSKEYEQMKQAGKLPGGLPIINPKPFSPSLEDMERLGAVHKMSSSAGSCGCYKAPDASYTLAMAPVDDGSSTLISIPFTFCMYGTNYTSLYINNNGNISFGTPYSTYSAVTFPTTLFVMVAPFWSDVDTRPAAGGTVKYKITPTAMYVNWTSVGYYSMMTDKVNTFQLIITDGTDPVLPSGDNIAFCYGDMQWTTGAASGGVGGFGGTSTGASPATVGVNKGDGVNYLQMGRFFAPGAAYDGGYGADDGVDWLDNQSLYFNVCSGSNIPPVASITPPLLGGSGGCDTLRLCGTNDTLLVSGLFLSPEIGQITNIVVNTYGTPGFSVLSNVPGNSATAVVQIIASPANAGLQLITFTATDDGVPAQTTTVNINVFIDTTGLAAFNPAISGVLDFCQGGSSTLSVAPTTFDSYIWSTGSTTTSTVVDSTGNYWVTSSKNGCFKTNLVHVTEHPNPTPVIAGYHYACGASGTTNLYVDSLIYTSYLWSTGSTNDSVTVGVGIYTVSVTDAFGCVGTSPPDTVTAPVPPVIVGSLALCNGDSSVLTTTIPYSSYSWSNGSTNDTAFTTAGTFTVSVIDINGCAITSAPITVSTFLYTFGASGVVPYCAGQSITLTANPSPAAGAGLLWSTAATTSTISVNTGGNYTVTVTYPNGCTADTTLIVAPPNPLPTPAITGNLFTCGASPTTLGIDSTSLYTGYLWSNASTNATIPVLTGTYTVTVTDPNGCTGTATATVVNANPMVSISGMTPFCPGDSITLTAIPTIPAGVTYTWSNTDNTSTTVVNSTGNISVTVSYANGCTAADTVAITQFSVPVANFSTSPPSPYQPLLPINFTSTSTVTPGTIVSWVWYFGDSTGVIGSTAPNPTHTYPVDGTYMVILAVQSSNGCWDTIMHSYTVESPLLAPNIFTPNNDGKNDMFAFKNLEYYPGADLLVYNRWGNKVYESLNYQNNWNGGGQADGVYYFILTVPRLDKPVTGFVQILR